MRFLRSTLLWKAFVIYVALSSIIHAALDGTNVSMLMLMAGISIVYGILGWILPGILLKRNDLSLPVTISIWLSPMILLAVFTLIYSYMNAEVPILLYIFASILNQVHPKIQKPGRNLLREWVWISAGLTAMLIIDLLLTGLYGILVNNAVNGVR